MQQISYNYQHLLTPESRMEVEPRHRTPLYEAHLSLSARMTDFAGWLMPLQYPAGIIKEHLHTRSSVSLFDTCHMGEFRVQGPGAAAALDRGLARTVSGQAIGSCRYNLLLSEEGGILDDMIVYRMDEGNFLLVVNAATRTQDFSHIIERLPPSVELIEETMITGKLDLQGPGSADALVRAGLAKEDIPAYFHWREIEFMGEKLLLSRTGYTGELGFEFYLPWQNTIRLWEGLLDNADIRPAGLGARDTLRLEAGLPLYGRELDADTLPSEAGLLPMINRHTGFVGEAFMNVKPRKRLVGLLLEGRRAARTGMEVFGPGLRRIGRVTSGSFAPSLKRAVAMAYIYTEETAEPGTRIFVGGPDMLLGAVIVNTPFYSKGTVRAML